MYQYRNYIVIILIVTIVVLQLGEVVLNNMYATRGIAYGALIKQIEDMKRENQILYQKVLEERAYAHIQSEAAKLGLTEGDNTIILR